MNKKWFVLHTLTGQENKALKSIEARKKLEALEDYIGQCIIPTERVTEKKNGKTRTITKKFFPGYVLAELALYDESREWDPTTGRRPFHERVWQFVRETPGVMGFVGVDSRDPKACPMPLKKSEMDAILSTGKAGAAEAPARPKVIFAVGETVKVNDGPFLGLTGTVSMVDPDKGKLKVEVSIFNRTVLVDAENWQVEKVKEEDLAKPDASV